mmetsp:Transcript_32194/g.32818  ORF Transcript_32194/g.32818 Transcript_32194/m.32818 type:complete len:231 (+) Transcript_32194:1283-1975(+)
MTMRVHHDCPRTMHKHVWKANQSVEILLMRLLKTMNHRVVQRLERPFRLSHLLQDSLQIIIQMLLFLRMLPQAIYHLHPMMAVKRLDQDIQSKHVTYRVLVKQAFQLYHTRHRIFQINMSVLNNNLIRMLPRPVRRCRPPHIHIQEVILGGLDPDTGEVAVQGGPGHTEARIRGLLDIVEVPLLVGMVVMEVVQVVQEVITELAHPALLEGQEKGLAVVLVDLLLWVSIT